MLIIKSVLVKLVLSRCPQKHSLLPMHYTDRIYYRMCIKEKAWSEILTPVNRLRMTIKSPLKIKNPQSYYQNWGFFCLNLV